MQKPYRGAIVLFAPSVLQVTNRAYVEKMESLLRVIGRYWAGDAMVEKFQPYSVVGSQLDRVSEYRKNFILRFVDAKRADLVIVAGSLVPPALETLLLELGTRKVPVWNCAEPVSSLYEYVEVLQDYEILQ